MQMCILRENVEREAGIGAKYHKALGFANASKKLGELGVVSLSLMALTNALCAGAGHYHCAAITVDRGAC